MQLLLACLAIFMAPAGALVLTLRQVDAIEAEFAHDAAVQIARLDRVAALYPPNLKKMKAAPAILQLKEMSSGAAVAANVCAVPDSPYRRLFDGLNSRCGDWRLYRRARLAAFVGIVVAAGAWALVLVARIIVRRYIDCQQSPGNWTLIYVIHGIPALLFGQIAVSLLGYGVFVQDLTGKPLYTVGLLLIPFLLLFLLERRLVLAFVEPHVFGAYRSRRGTRRRRLARP